MTEQVPENTEIPEPQIAAPELQESKAASPPESSDPPAVEQPRGRGRPAGSKDRAPRAKPKVRVEPIPQPASIPDALPPTHRIDTPRPPSPALEAQPPSPQTLFRQTSARLINLRDAMNSQRRTSIAEKYTSKLHSWSGI